MAACERHLGGEPDGLICLGTGTPHEHVYEASDAPDRHADSEAAAERGQG